MFQINTNKITIVSVGIFALTIIGLIFTFILFNWPGSDTNGSNNHVLPTNFEECRNKGGVILDSYPEQCLYEGKTYTRELSAEEPREPSQPVKTMEIKLFFTSEVLISDNCGATAEVSRTIPYTQTPAKAAFEELFKGPTAIEKNRGLQGTFTGWDKVFQGVNLKADGSLIVDFSQEILKQDSPYWLGNFGASCSGALWQQMFETARQFDSVKYVVFTVDGDPTPWAATMIMRGCGAPQNLGEPDDSYLEYQKQCGEAD